MEVDLHKKRLDEKEDEIKELKQRLDKMIAVAHDYDCERQEKEREIEELKSGLELIAYYKGKTLLGCDHDEYHKECEGKKSYEVGANKAFDQVASIAIELLAKRSPAKNDS